MEGISKIIMSSFFLLGLFLVVPTTAARTNPTTVTCAAVNANLSACDALFDIGVGVGIGIGQGVGVGVGVGVGAGVGVMPPKGCCTGLQQIGAIEAQIGGPRTCQCLQGSKIFSNPLNISVNARILDGLLASCAVVVGANISIDLRCLHI